MSKEHLTPDGWKPCNASTRECQYDGQRIADASSFIESAVGDLQAGKPNVVKNFFNALFGSKTMPPSSVPPEPVTSVTSAVPPVLDKVTQGLDGRYQVSCKDLYSDEVFVHKFGDLVKDKETAEMLHNVDPRKIYQLGECGVLAGELWHLNDHVEEYYIYKTADEPDFGMHQFVQLKDGTYADSMGVWTEEALLSYWREVDPDGKITPFALEDSPVERNLNWTISSPKLFNAVSEVISTHMKTKGM